MHRRLAGFSCRGVDAVRRFPYLIVVFGVAILLVLGSAFFYFRPGGGDAVLTPATDVEAAAAMTAAPPVSLSTMAEAVPIVTETPRILSTAAPAESGVDKKPAGKDLGLAYVSDAVAHRGRGLIAVVRRGTASLAVANAGGGGHGRDRNPEEGPRLSHRRMSRRSPPPWDRQPGWRSHRWIRLGT